MSAVDVGAAASVPRLGPSVSEGATRSASAGAPGVRIVRRGRRKIVPAVVEHFGRGAALVVGSRR